MSQWDVEVFVPLRILGVGEDACTGDGGLGDGDGDVRVTGDNLAVVAEFKVFGGGGSTAGFEGDATGEAAGDQVHVWQTTSLDYTQFQVSV